MFAVLSDRSFRHLFAAQLVALIGTGLASVALGLLAFDLAADQAGMVLGAVFTIKMVAYVPIAPIAGAFADRLPRRAYLAGLDIVRLLVAVALPFVTEVWQVFALIFALQAASAGFTPVFQATIPDVLPEEDRYTQGLALSRMTYDLESIISPTLAALLLLAVSYDTLFLGTALGFLGSAVLILTVMLPAPKPTAKRGIYDRTTLGTRVFLATPRLRGLMALNVTVAAAGAMVLVNTVVLVRADLGLSEGALAWTMFAFGLGSMFAALALPRVLTQVADRPVMLFGAVLMIGGLILLALLTAVYGLRWPALLLCWLILGLGFSTLSTPAGRLLRRSAHAADRPALFAAQFALSHFCWLFAYPLAGVLITWFGVQAALLVLALIATLGMVAAMRLWPVGDPVEVAHTHHNLPPDHPHLQGGGHRHSHALIIDEDHPRWATRF